MTTVNQLLKQLTKLKQDGHGRKTVYWAGAPAVPLDGDVELGRYEDGSRDGMEPEFLDEDSLELLIEEGSLPKNATVNGVGIS